MVEPPGPLTLGATASNRRSFRWMSGPPVLRPSRPTVLGGYARVRVGWMNRGHSGGATASALTRARALDHAARVEDLVGVQGRLDRPHHADGVLALLLLQPVAPG